MATTTFSPNMWWICLTLFLSAIVAQYEIQARTMEEQLTATITKLAAMVSMAVLSYVITHIFCTKSQSLNTHKLREPTQPSIPRNPSHKYGLIKPSESSFKWIEQAHLDYVEKHLPNDGAYTVLRTVEKYNLFQFNMHLQRLLNTIYQQKNLEIPSKILRRILLINIRDGLDEFYDDEIIQPDEARIMIYVDSVKLYKLLNTQSTKKSVTTDEIEEKLEECIVIHFGALPNLRRPISACIRIGRHVFEHGEKSTSWAKDRNKFHKDIDKELGLNEILMTEVKEDRYGYVMEGLSSNFAVLQQDMTLLTASEDMGILGGTVMGFMIDIMREVKESKEEDINQYGVIPKEIVYGRANIEDIMKWKGMVIMSTSRLLVPIDNLYIDIDDDMLLKLVGGNKDHDIFKVGKSDDCGCGYRKIVYGSHLNDNEDNHGKDDYLENMRVFIKHHMKSESHSVYVGSVFNK